MALLESSFVVTYPHVILLYLESVYTSLSSVWTVAWSGAFVTVMCLV